MALSRIAERIASEIRDQDWSDSHTRLDGSRHDRLIDHSRSPQLEPGAEEHVRLNVVWVIGQALAEEDPNFSIREFAKAAGVPNYLLLTNRGTASGVIEAGLRPRGRVVRLLESGAWMAIDEEADPSSTPSNVAVAVASTPSAAVRLLG